MDLGETGWPGLSGAAGWEAGAPPFGKAKTTPLLGDSSGLAVGMLGAAFIGPCVCP